MRLSEVKGERVIDVLADLVEPLANIAEDDELAELFSASELPKGLPPRKFLARRLRKAMPRLLRGHKSDLVAIMAAVEGQDPKEYAEQMTMATLVKGVYEILTDDELLAFLSTPETQGGTSGSL